MKKRASRAPGLHVKYALSSKKTRREAVSHLAIAATVPSRAAAALSNSAPRCWLLNRVATVASKDSSRGEDDMMESSYLL